MTWAGYAPDSEEVVLTNPDPLPPAEEMIGVIDTPEEAGERGEEIQLAHGEHGHRGHGHGHRGHGHGGHGDGHGGHGHGHVNFNLIGNVCRGSLGYCYTAPVSVGTSCYCISVNLFGLPYVWLYGNVTTD